MRTLWLTMLLYQREPLKKRRRKNENGIVFSVSLACDKHCVAWQPKRGGNTRQEKPRKAALGLSENQIDERISQTIRSRPADIQNQANAAYRLWKVDPYYPSLHFKRIDPEEPIYSVRIGLYYRAVGTKYNQRKIEGWFLCRIST